MSMNINLRVGETVRFNDGLISITVMEKTGQRIKLRVDADDSVSIQPPPKERRFPDLMDSVAMK